LYVIYSRIIIFLYLLVGVLPYFYAADKVDSQTLYLNILNLTNLFVIVKNHKKRFITELINSASNVPVVFMGLFFLWSSISIIPANNKVEALISLSEILTLLISLVFLIFHFNSFNKQKREKLIFILILVLTSAELISVYFPYLKDIIDFGQPSFQAIRYRGMAGNINVMSYSLVLKLPFLIYYLFTTKNYRYYTYLLIILLTYAIFSILETRSAILSLTIITAVISILYYTIQKQRSIVNILKKIILPIFIGLLISLIQSNLTSKSSVQDRMGTLLEIEEDQSITQRLRYISAAIESIKKNPVLGIGVGNWELESIRYERINMQDYTVPYHAHNDYLEIFAESGLLAVIFYFGPLLLIVYLIVKQIFYNKEGFNEKHLLYISILCAILVYLLDSMVNFPQARIMSQMNLIFLLCISTLFFNLKISTSPKFIKPAIFLCITLLPLSLYSSIRVYSSSIDQTVLIRQLNSSDFSIPSIDIVDKFQSTYPNVTPTAMPISSMKAMWFMTNKQYDKAIDLFKEGTNKSPHLYFSESFLGYSYEMIGEKDSAMFYSKRAFDKAPDDLIHFGNYMFTLAGSNDSLTIKEAYERVDEKVRLPGHDEIYVTVMASLKDPSSKFTLDGIDINFQSGNDRLKKGYYMLQVGEDKMFEADFYYQNAMEDFDNEEFEKAAQLFIKASELNPYEFVYLENAANSYMKIGKDQEALQLLNKLLNDLGSESAKAHYFRGLLLYGFDQVEEACLDLKIADDYGLLANTSIYLSLCGN